MPEGKELFKVFCRLKSLDYKKLRTSWASFKIEDTLKSPVSCDFWPKIHQKQDN